MATWGIVQPSGLGCHKGHKWETPLARAEDCAPLLNSNASSLSTTDDNLASLSKLGLTLCIPPLLVAVDVVSVGPEAFHSSFDDD